MTKRCQHIFSRAKQHGYSLVEVAIALAVVGIILGGAVLPLGNLLRQDAYERAELQIGKSVDAVVGYAMANRSPGFTYLYTDTNSATTNLRKYGFRLANIPAGRPYLPCPDVDGDGIEDRTELVIPTLDSELAFEYGQDETGIVRSQREYQTTSALGQEDNELIEVGDDAPLGSCEVYAGSLPWRTLGLPSSDPWGSRLTYAVNPMFATAAFGFDQQTRAASHLNINETDFVNDDVQLTYPNDVRTATAPNLFYNPIVPCTLDRDAVCYQGAYRFGDAFYAHGTGSLNLHNVPAGETDVPIDIPLEYYAELHSAYVPESYYDAPGNFRYRTISDGLPFVIISHGANRAGARTDNRGTSTVCASVSTIAAPANNFELANAVLANCNAATSTPSFFLFNTIRNNRLIPIYAFRRANLEASNPATSSEYGLLNDVRETINFDDVVGWLTRRELRELMRDRGVFPLPETFHGLLSGKASYLP